MRGVNLTNEEARNLPIGTPLVAVDSQSGTVRTGNVCVKIEDSAASADCISVRRIDEVGPGRTACNSYYGTRFRLYDPTEDTLDVCLANVSAHVSAQLQELVFGLGDDWEWGDNRDSEVSLEAPDLGTMLFDVSTEIIYDGIITTEVGGRIWLDASNPVDLACAKCLLSGMQDLPQASALARLLTQEVIDLINNSPTSPTLRGLIRAQTGKAVPHDVMAGGTAAITKWLEENVRKPLADAETDLTTPGPVARAPSPATTPTPAPYGRTRRVTYDLTEIESGSCNYSVEVRYRGTIDVPEHVIADGEEAVDGYVRERATNRGGDYGEYSHDNYECSYSRTDEWSCNADEVCEAYVAENTPDEGEDEEDDE